VRLGSTRPSARYSGRREVVIGLGVYAVYLAVRQAVYDDAGRKRAAHNAQRIVDFERRLHMHVEPAVQHVCVHRQRMTLCLNGAYMSLNIVLTVGSLMRLYFTRHPAFHGLRRAAALATLGAQPSFLLFPTAPPRTLDGFTDTLREISGFDLDSGLIARLYDPIAAMPSIHCAYAVITSSALSESFDSPVVRGLARAYPPAVVATVLATGNHYVADAAAGCVLGAAALRLARTDGGRFTAARSAIRNAWDGFGFAPTARRSSRAAKLRFW
jgi:hypothetical protein